MASQSFTLSRFCKGSVVFLPNGSLPVEADLIANGANAYLRQVSRNFSTFTSQLLSTAVGSRSNAGPDLTTDWESIAALVRLEKVSSSIALNVPNHSVISSRDSSDPYEWVPDNDSALVMWVNRLESGDVPLMPDDRWVPCVR